jgi:hypothetical protein
VGDGEVVAGSRMLMGVMAVVSGVPSEGERLRGMGMGMKVGNLVG